MISRLGLLTLLFSCATALGMDNTGSLENTIELRTYCRPGYDFYIELRMNPSDKKGQPLTITSEKSAEDTTGEKQKPAEQKLNGSFYFIPDDDDSGRKTVLESFGVLPQEGPSELLKTAPVVNSQNSRDSGDLELGDLKTGYQSCDDAYSILGYEKTSRNSAKIQPTSLTDTGNSDRKTSQKDSSLNSDSPVKNKSPLLEIKIFKGFEGINLKDNLQSRKEDLKFYIESSEGKVLIFDGEEILKLPPKDKSFVFQSIKGAHKHPQKEANQLIFLIEKNNRNGLKDLQDALGDSTVVIETCEKASLSEKDFIDSIASKYAHNEPSMLRYLTLWDKKTAEQATPHQK